ncbi:MAG: NAD(+) synthase [Pseudomonadota bacterium]
MKLIKLAAATLNQTPMTWDGNQSRIVATIEAARQQGVDILCLPELSISGYGCEDAFLSVGVLRQAERVLLEIAPQTKNMIVAVGLPVLHQNRVYNTACLLVNGEIGGFVAKRFLPGDGIHYEPRWFHPWPPGLRDIVKIGGKTYPIGDIDFDCGGVQIGFEICEEAWVAKRPGIDLAHRGVDIILNLSASHFAFDKYETRQRFVLEGSRAFSAAYVYANLLGNESGRVIYDGGAMIAANGELKAMSERFSFADWQLVSAVVDINLTRMAQARTSRFEPNPEGCISLPFEFPERLPEPAAPEQITLGSWEKGAHLKEEEFGRAVALGLYDYLRKSRSHGFVVSLSGGADSGAIACLIRCMVELGVHELGMAGFCEKLSYRDLPQENIDTLMGALLTCVYQATRNSSETTRNAAESVAKGVSAKYMELNIDTLVAEYTRLVSGALGRELAWETDDLALQNIQARTRSPGVWMIANIHRALLLSTSNRSEAAVGYATMDGDTSGGLSPIAGIDKHFLRQWLCWLETEGLMGFSPIPELTFINAQQPTAELRPGHNQTDEDDLMPYELLNAVELAGIRDRQTPWEIFCLLRSRFTQYDKAQLLTWIERFFQLWSRNQWKRERYAPSFHLDDENLDPKTWCRFPILSGSFEHELAEMRQRAETL